MIVSLILLMSSDIAFKTSGCHEAKFSADLDKTELLITRGANISLAYMKCRLVVDHSSVCVTPSSWMERVVPSM